MVMVLAVYGLVAITFSLYIARLGWIERRLRRAARPIDGLHRALDENCSKRA